MTDQQITDTLLMIRPVAFHRNEQTAVNNYYQKVLEGMSGKDDSQKQALEEFDLFVEKLRAVGIRVLVFRDTLDPETPDSIFPNNWVSFHESGEVFLYPMYAENRRKERREDILDLLSENYRIGAVSGFVEWESENKFLEGTGSLILDRANKIAYAALSERTHPDVLEDFGRKAGYNLVSFSAFQTVGDDRLPIYHTNVMMCLGEHFALVCLDSIDDELERNNLIRSFDHTHKEVIFITEEQTERFAGNMLQVKNTSGDRFIIMSESAFKSLDLNQKKQLEKHGRLLYSSLDTIECLGGGSARCMMAEMFLPQK